MQQNNKLPGLYIAAVGPDGSGKTTLITNLSKQLKEDYPHLKITTTREPGGTPLAETLRKIVKTEKLSPFREAEMFARARASSLAEVVRPALTNPYGIVISDRFELDSHVYQGFARGLGILTVEELNKEAVGETHPDIIIYLNVGYKASKERLLETKRDKFDSETSAFFNLVSLGYEHVLPRWQEKHPGVKIIKIDDPEGKISPEGILRRVILNLDPEIWRWEGIEEKTNRERGK